MVILTIDIGGTTVKSAFWEAGRLTHNPPFSTPKTWSEMKHRLVQLKTASTDGVAISLPGSVDSKTGEIGGISAVPYLPQIEIKKELDQAFRLPVTFQNDANCAGLAESWLGNVRSVNLAALMILGTGVGGCIVKKGQIWEGKDNFGGEFGYMVLSPDGKTLSELASPVKMTKRYQTLIEGVSPIAGETVFQEASEGNILAKKCLDEMFHWISIGIYNIIVAFNPDRLLVGGGISVRSDFIEQLKKDVGNLLRKNGAGGVQTQIMSCKFHNDANLIGAVYQYLSENNPAMLVK